MKTKNIHTVDLKNYDVVQYNGELLMKFRLRTTTMITSGFFSLKAKKFTTTIIQTNKCELVVDFPFNPRSLEYDLIKWLDLACHTSYGV